MNTESCGAMIDRQIFLEANVTMIDSGVGIVDGFPDTTDQIPRRRNDGC
jgi:hypothetical protein